MQCWKSGEWEEGGLAQHPVRGQQLTGHHRRREVLGPSWLSVQLASPRLGHAQKSWILDPSGDYYYWWLSLMVVPVMYNWIILICR